jgi:hypothetical protein
MATMSERVSLTYSGDVALEVGAGANPNPSIVEPGETIEVDEWAAESLLNSGGPWAPVGAAPEGVLTGKALNDALKAEGLSTTGTAAEKRARLVEHEAAQELAAQQAPQDPEVDPSSATDDDQTETDA